MPTLDPKPTLDLKAKQEAAVYAATGCPRFKPGSVYPRLLVRWKLPPPIHHENASSSRDGSRLKSYRPLGFQGMTSVSSMDLWLNYAA